jgi:hypothetical protein
VVVDQFPRQQRSRLAGIFRRWVVIECGKGTPACSGPYFRSEPRSLSSLSPAVRARA